MNHAAVGRGDGKLGEQFRAVAQIFGAPDDDRSPAVLVDHHAGPHAFELGAKLVLERRQRHARHAGGHAVDIDLHITHRVIGDGEYLGRAGHL